MRQHGHFVETLNVCRALDWIVTTEVWWDTIGWLRGNCGDLW